MREPIQQYDNPTLPVTAAAATTTHTVLSTFEDSIEPSTILATFSQEQLVESIKDRLRILWQSGSGWRLEFGRELREYRKVTQHGEWIKFLESEFGLHRQTAYNWMRKAAAADGVSLDEPQNNNDESDAYADEVAGLIAEEQARVEKAEDVKLNGPKPYRLLLDSVTEDEKDMFKAELKSDREWVQSILRAAFETIIAGKPVVHTGGKLPETPEDPMPGIDDGDPVEMFFGDDVELTDEECVAIFPDAYAAGYAAGEIVGDALRDAMLGATYHNPEDVN
jgi:hypothetical protein